MRTIEQLQEMLSIDQNNLEVELMQQPQLFSEVADAYAQAAGRRDTAKHIAEKAAAEIGVQHKQAAYPEKVTEAATERYVAANPTYIEQYRFYLQYKLEADRWEALKSAYAQRSSMLRDLIQLLAVGYWGSGLRQEDRMAQKYAENYRALREKAE